MDFKNFAWTAADYKAYQNKLFGLADEGYREFTARGVFTDRPLLGVRLPVLRTLVRPIAQGNFTAFLAHEPVSVEEVLARGFCIGRLPYDVMLQFFPSHLPYLDNWETVDCFAASLKSIKPHLADFYQQILEPLLLTPSPEFITRLAIVLLLDYYVQPEYLHVIFDHATRLGSRDEYYVKMALAWLLAETFIKFPDQTLPFLKKSPLPRWTHNKTISKICDSYRVEKSVKEMLKTLRK